MPTIAPRSNLRSPDPLCTLTDRCPTSVRRCAQILLGLLVAGLAGSGWPDLQTPVRTGRTAPLDTAVVIGVERYDVLPWVPYAGRDADAAYQWVLQTRGVPPNRVTRLRDPARPQIAAALDRAIRQSVSGGTLWVFFSGHGLSDPADATHHLLARDDRSAEDALSLEGLVELLAMSRADRVLVVVDAAFSGVGRDGRKVDPERTFATPAPAVPADPRIALWTAAGPGELAGPLEAARQGLFTWHVLAALRGFADGAVDAPDGRVTLEEAQLWVQRRLAVTTMRQTSTVDPRPEVRGWEVAEAWRDAPEDLDALAPGPAPDLSALPAPPEDPEDDSAEARAEAEAKVREHVQSLADRKWSETYRLVQRGDPAAVPALHDFVGRFSAIRYPIAGGDIVVGASQVPEARRLLLNGGRPTAPLVRSVRLGPAAVTLGSAAGTPGRTLDETLHTARLTRAFEVGVTEVTQSLWTTVMGDDPSTHPGPDRPVETVSWREAIAFCNALSLLDGYAPAYEVRGNQVVWDTTADGWRLPTEAEWTRAAGPGRWAGTDELPGACRHGNVADEAAGDPPAGPLGAFRCDDGYATTSPVRLHGATSTGLYGIGGNVAEWTWDAYAPFGGDAVVDPAPDRPAKERVIKGGSFRSAPHQARLAARRHADRDARFDDVGLRVVRTVTPAP